jgi:hypothetical protein
MKTKYRWDMDGEIVTIIGPSYGFLGGNFNRMEKDSEEFKEKAAGKIIHLVGVCDIY